MGQARTAIIIGAGPGGLAAAGALRRAAWQVIVCERSASLAGAGSGLTLWPNATRALAALDLLPALMAATRPLTAIAMRNWHGRTLFEQPLAALLDEPQFPSVGLLRAELIDLLADPVRDCIRPGAQVIDFTSDDDRVVVHLADGRELAGDVLIGADGLNSVVRARLLGNEPAPFAGYAVWRGIAAMGFEPAVGTTWMGPARQFGLFPLKGERTYWFASGAARQDCADLSGASLASLLAEAPAPINRVVGATSQDAILCTDIYDRDPLDRWSFGRVTLLGDAAHPAAPTLGQGACQAIEDALVLGACLAGAGDVATALRSYDARRIRRANGFVVEARRLGRMGLWKNPILCLFRDAMIAAMPLRVHRRELTRMFAFEV